MRLEIFNERLAFKNRLLQYLELLFTGSLSREGCLIRWWTSIFKMALRKTFAGYFHNLTAAARVCNMVTGNPRTREKTMWKQAQGMGGLRVWDFQVYRTDTRSFSSHMVFLGNFLGDPKTRKCHFCWFLLTFSKKYF